MDAQTLLLALLVVVSAAVPGCNRQDNIRPKTIAAEVGAADPMPAPNIPRHADRMSIQRAE